MTPFLLLWLAAQNISQEALQHVNRGMEAHQRGNLDQTIAEFRRVTELAPDLPAAFVNLGAVYLERLAYTDALPPLKRALELDNTLVGAHQMLGYALLSAGHAAEAIPHLEAAHADELLGVAQLETGKLQEAIANLQAELAKRPTDPDLLYYLGRASALFSKQVLDTLVSGHPDSPRAHQAIAENYSALHRVPEAEREYLAALRLKPDTPGLHLGLGILYSESSQWSKAEAEFRAEVKLRPGDAEAEYRLGSALLTEGKSHDARVELEHANQLQPDMPETLHSLGKAASLDGDFASAQKWWERQIGTENEGELAAQAHFGLANLFRKQGKTAEAEREMEAFRKLQKAEIH